MIVVLARALRSPTCHDDGSVSYQDPASGAWVQRALHVPARAQAVMRPDERTRVARCLVRGAELRALRGLVGRIDVARMRQIVEGRRPWARRISAVSRPIATIQTAPSGARLQSLVGCEPSNGENHE